MSEIKLKSRLVKAYDPDKIDVSEFVVPLKPDPEIAERDLTNFMRRFAVKSEAQEVRAQDTVTLSCTAENPKFNRQHLTLRVGLGLFSKEFEAALVGLAAGEKRTLTVGADTAEVTVEKIIRESIPPLTDAMAKSCGVRGIDTATDVYDYCRGKQFNDYLEMPADDAFVKISNGLISGCEFALDAEELREADETTASVREKLKEIAAEAGAEAAGTPEEAQMQAEELANLGVSILKNAVLGCAMLEREGALLTIEDYERSVRAKAEAYKISQEEARKKESQTIYAINKYSDKFMDAVEEYALERLKKEGLRLGEEKKK